MPVLVSEQVCLQVRELNTLRGERTLQQTGILIIIMIMIMIITTVHIMFTMCKVNQVSARCRVKEGYLVSDHFSDLAQYMCQCKDFMEMVSVGFSNIK